MLARTELKRIPCTKVLQRLYRANVGNIVHLTCSFNECLFKICLGFYKCIMGFHSGYIGRRVGQ